MVSELDRTPNAPGTRGAAADMSDAELASVRQYSTASAAPSTELGEAQRFLRALYGEGAPGWCPVFLLPSKVAHWVRARDLERVADTGLQAAERGQNVYVPVGLQADRLETGRGAAATVCALAGLWADIDYQSPAHKTANLPPTESDALALLAEVPLEPTIVVHSGHGLQAWWLFRELWTFDTDAERLAAATLSERWQATLQGLAARHGWAVDATADLARVLRLPGTVNRKADCDPVPVRLVNLDDANRYTRDDFEPYLADVPDSRGNGSAPVVSDAIPAGQRNATLTSLAGTMRRRGMGESAIVAALRAENATRCQPPLPEAEIRRIAHSVAGYEPAEPPTEPEHLTDLGNARRFARLHQRDVRYCHPWARWIVWDGRRWAIDTTGEVERRGKATVAGIYAEAANCGDEDRRKELAKHALRSEAASKVAAMVSLAASEPGVPVLPEDLDALPFAFNCENGTLEGRAMGLREHRREDLITRIGGTSYDSGAWCPLWLAFLDRVMDGNTRLVDFLQRAVGYSLTGDTSERCMFILHGRGKNGKTTFVETVARVLGEYAVRTPTETLLAKHGDSIPNDIARLKGARFVYASESEEGRRLAESQIKAMTGRDTLVARYLRAEYFEFKPEFKLWLDTNNKPVIRGTDDAIWDRIMLVPFTVRIPDAEQDRHLGEKLEAELPGILAWAVQGCVAWQRDGLQPPPEVRRATQSYREESDLLADFLAERCNLDSNLKVRAQDLTRAYAEWCEAAGERPLTGRALATRLQERGFEKRHERVGAMWYGLGLSVRQCDG